MKLSPKIYAKTLIETASSDNLKEIAANFWRILQKNKQYKDLAKVMDALDIEAASKDGKTIAKVYSETALSKDDIDAINDGLTNKFRDSKFEIRNFVKKGITGIIVKVDDQIIDFTVESKINRMKKALNNQ